MAEKPAYLRKFRDLAKSDPKFEDVEALEAELYTLGNDRATAVLFGSFVDTSLERLLASKMRQDLSSEMRGNLFGPNGPLGTFSSKIALAYALKLVGPISHGDLELIRELRNQFAHSRMSFTFETPAVREVIARFRIPDQPKVFVPIRYLERFKDPAEREAAADIKAPRTRFIVACHELAKRIFTQINYPQEGDAVYPNDEPLP